jgi:plastocyanin
MRRFLFVVVCCWTVLEGSALVQRQTVTVTASIVVAGSTTSSGRPDAGDVAVWLTPVGEPPRAAATTAPRRLRILQKDKRFTPHLVVMPVGSVVDFPNADPFFHNVFSMYDGKRFDLGLYESGASRSVTFSRPGICYIFCNIHPEMSAVIVVVDTPFAAVSTRTGEVTIPDVPPGRYQLSVWHDRYAPATVSEAPREVMISETNRDLGMIRLIDTGTAIPAHKNKFGHDYSPPAPPSPVYR